ncbi:MAG: glycosyltransferase, partial [Promethearchaeota archaeon]
KSKIILSVHTNLIDASSFTFWFIKIQQMLFYPFADKVITVSKGISRGLRLKNTKTIYNMQKINKNLELSKNTLTNKYEEIFYDNFIFINIGRLTKSKGHWFLIRAFKTVVEKYPRSKLIILGDGDLRKKLNFLIYKLNLNQNVHLLGFRENVFPYLRKADCFVLSSLWEGLGIALIEALSMNLPVISTDCKVGPREVLCPDLSLNEKISYPYEGKYGILTKPFENKFLFKTLNETHLSKEEEMFADQMLNIIANKQIKEKYSKGIERTEDFEVKNIINKWEEII